MSLIKAIRQKNGLMTGYHRIADINKNGADLTVIINSYVSKDYRDMELKLVEMKEIEADKMMRMSILTGMGELSDEDQNELNEINEWFDEYQHLSEMNGEFHATSFSIPLQWTGEDISFADLYTSLKTGDTILKDAIDG